MRGIFLEVTATGGCASALSRGGSLNFTAPYVPATPASPCASALSRSGSLNIPCS